MRGENSNFSDLGREQQLIAHFWKEWYLGTQTKRALIYAWDCLETQVEQPPWITTRHASCCVFCAQITSGTSRSARPYICTSCVFFPVVLAPRQRSHLWSCFTVHSSGFSRAKITPGTSSSFSFTFSCFFLSISPSVLLFWDAETFHFAFRHV